MVFFLRVTNIAVLILGEEPCHKAPLPRRHPGVRAAFLLAIRPGKGKSYEGKREGKETEV
jgi:hypothetical protein